MQKMFIFGSNIGNVPDENLIRDVVGNIVVVDGQEKFIECPWGESEGLLVICESDCDFSYPLHFIKY